MDIRGFVESLRGCRELLEIPDEVDGRFELAVLTDLMCKHEGPGLLFSRVKGSNISLATNLLGSDRRMANALGHDNLEAFGQWLTAALAGVKGDSSAQRLRLLLRSVEREQKPSTCFIKQQLNLDLLPELRFWPAEQRSFFTLAVVITSAPDSNIQNYGLYRVGIVDRKRFTLNLLPGSGAGRHLEQWRSMGKSMPVAILLGADPALIFAAAAPLPPDFSEEHFSAFINQGKIQSCHCQTVPLSCPISAQIIIEGWVDTESVMDEGPFGCYTGDYGGSNVCPLVEISGLSMVSEPLIPLTLAGPLPMEDCWIARANLEIIRARLRVDIPEINSIEMPLEAAFYGLYFVTCIDPLVSVDELSQRMRSLDYLARMKTLILLHNTDDFVSETNWRVLLKNIPTAQIWQDGAADLGMLMNTHPAKLQHDARIIEKMKNRLRIAATESTPLKGQ